MAKRLTGFDAYAAYICTKRIHLADNKFDLSKATVLPRKAALIDKWNRERRHKDGNIFYKINQKYQTIPELVLLYSAYWLKNPNFYARDIIDDDFRYMKKMEAELRDPNVILRVDWDAICTYCEDNDVTLKHVLFGPGLPQIFSMSVSPVTLIILDKVLSIFGRVSIDEVNVLLKDRYIRAKIIFDKISKSVESYLSDYDWTEEVKTLLGGYDG